MMPRTCGAGAGPLQVALALALLGMSAGLPSAPGQAQMLNPGGDQPIEITADSLEVLQEEQLATFTGNVDAVQGDLVLSADVLRVHYQGSGGAGGPSDAGSIRRIEAEGNVFLSSPQETAQGDSGTYDVVGNLLTIEGSVILTRDDNVIRGQRLEIDLVSGRSRMVAAVTSDEGGQPADRVRAIFVPEGTPGPAGSGDADTAAGTE